MFDMFKIRNERINRQYAHSAIMANLINYFLNAYIGIAHLLQYLVTRDCHAQIPVDLLVLWEWEFGSKLLRRKSEKKFRLQSNTSVFKKLPPEF